METPVPIPAPAPAAPPKAKILVVDDDVFLSEIFGNFLTRGGYSVEYARNGREGLEAAQAKPYDLILMDVMMPELSGFEALTRLKADPRTKDIPVIMLTSMSQREDVAEGLNAGAVAYLAKQEVIPSDTLAKVGQVLASAKKRPVVPKVEPPKIATKPEAPVKKPRKTTKKK